MRTTYKIKPKITKKYWIFGKKKKVYELIEIKFIDGAVEEKKVRTCKNYKDAVWSKKILEG